MQVESSANARINSAINKMAMSNFISVLVAVKTLSHCLKTATGKKPSSTGESKA